jgi:hypothetical protein
MEKYCLNNTVQNYKVIIFWQETKGNISFKIF